MNRYVAAKPKLEPIDEHVVDVKGQSRSTLFLIEQLVVIFIFAICAVICISIFVESYLIGKSSLEVNNAIRVAGNGAESYISAGGDVNNAVRFLGGINSQAEYRGDLVVYYNEQWQPSEKEQASYVLRIIKTDNPAPSLIIAAVTVSRTDGEDLFTMTIAAREDKR
jgi:type II secretory pathway pseudopilin PulG